MYDCKIIDRSAVCGCRLSAALNGDRTAPFYGAAVKALEGGSPQAVQICACKAIYVLTPKVGHDVLQPVLNALYEGEAYAFNALQITLW